ncbi:hypothetical protein ACTA71_006136 [Dictyostelium dimigraforme]
MHYWNYLNISNDWCLDILRAPSNGILSDQDLKFILNDEKIELNNAQPQQQPQTQTQRQRQRQRQQQQQQQQQYQHQHQQQQQRQQQKLTGLGRYPSDCLA